MSVRRFLLYVFLGRPVFLFLCGFHVRACLEIVDVGFRSVWPIHPHRLFLISSPTFCWCIFSHKSLLLMVFGQRIWRILLRQLLIKVRYFLVVVLVVLSVSDPYSSTFILVLNRRICVCNDTTLELQMFFSCINAPLALPILALTSTTAPPCLSIILPRYVKVSTSSISFKFDWLHADLLHLPWGFLFCIYVYLTPLVKRWLPVHLSSPASVDGCGFYIFKKNHWLRVQNFRLHYYIKWKTNRTTCLSVNEASIYLMNSNILNV